MSKHDASFGEKLRQYREAVGLTQEELAERAGLSADAVGALERGRRQRPYPNTVRMLADALGLSADDRTTFVATASQRNSTEVASEYVDHPPTSPAVRIPRSLTEFIGRERESAVVLSLLRRPSVRLLTLTGPGGVGKTELSLHVAQEAAGDFADGVVFAGLAPLRDATLFPSAIAQALDLRDVGTASLLDALSATIADRQLLLLLDNFEHVAEAAPEVVHLLLACPRLKILVTSRSALKVRGEQEYRVPPLELPAMTPDLDIDQLFQSPAVQLFVARAQASVPEFDVTSANARTVAEICVRLDGLPLALELAGARVALLPPPALLARLERGIGVLAGGPREVPSRQQTMRNAIAWSHDLLDIGTQTLFRRLAVFAGGFTLEDADAVVAGPGDPAIDTFEGIALLAEQSLVRREDGRETADLRNPRFGMLETVREYALERLVSSEEETIVRQAHLAWCAALVEQANRELWEAHHGSWPSRLADEYDNIRVAITWAIESGEVETGLRVTSALWKFIRSQGHVSEVRLWQQRLLAASETVPPSVYTDALWLAGDLAGLSGDYRAAAALLEQSLESARQLGDQLAIAKALYLLGNVAEDLEDLDRMVVLFQEALELFRSIDARWWIAETISSLGRAARKVGDYPRAMALHQEALALQRNSDNSWGVAWATTALGELAADQGKNEEAIALIRESIQLHQQVADLSGIYYCLLSLGKLAGTRGQFDSAARLLGAAEAMREVRGVALQPDHRESHDRCVAHARAQLGDEAFSKAWSAGRALSPAQAINEAIEVADRHIDPNISADPIV